MAKLLLFFISLALAALLTGCLWGPPPYGFDDEEIALPDPSQIDEVIITDEPPSKLPGGGPRVTDVTVYDHYLIVNIEYSSGGGGNYSCYMTPSSFTGPSSSAQADLFIRDTGSRSYILVAGTARPVFDLSPLAEIYYQQYGKLGYVELNIYDQTEQRRFPKFSVYYKPSFESD